MTKAGAKKDLLNFFVNRQRWSIVHDESFTAGKKMLTEQSELVLSCLQRFAEQNRVPWFIHELEAEPFEDEVLLQNLRNIRVVSGP